MFLTIEYSGARRLFRRTAGQANHFLVTILVGLDAVSTGNVERAPAFSTTWNPRSTEASARRSREFALSSAMVLVVDCLDNYLKAMFSTFPSELPPTLLSAPGAGRSTRRGKFVERVESVGRNLNVNDVTMALVESAIVARNRASHASRDIRLSPSAAGTLRSSAARLAEDFQGLEVDQLIDKLRSHSANSLTFKEVTSLIRAIHQYVHDVDHAVLGQTDLSTLVASSVTTFLREKEATSRARAAEIWGRDAIAAEKKIRTIARNYGGFKEAEDARYYVDPKHLREMAEMSPAAGLERFAPSSSRTE